MWTSFTICSDRVTGPQAPQHIYTTDKHNPKHHSQTNWHKSISHNFYFLLVSVFIYIHILKKRVSNETVKKMYLNSHSNLKFNTKKFFKKTDKSFQQPNQLQTAIKMKRSMFVIAKKEKTSLFIITVIIIIVIIIIIFFIIVVVVIIFFIFTTVIIFIILEKKKSQSQTNVLSNKCFINICKSKKNSLLQCHYSFMHKTYHRLSELTSQNRIKISIC